MADSAAMSVIDLGAERRARLADGAAVPRVRRRVPSARPRDPRTSTGLLRAAIAGGVDIVQLREKQLGDDELVAVAHAARALCERLGALLIVNDRPAVALEAGADGVHVGQDDMPVAEVRELVGPEMLIGLSTHAREEIDAARPRRSVDYIGVGPVHETPTKPGRPAVGLGARALRRRERRSRSSRSAGSTPSNVGEVLAAGARRVCVLRAIADAEDAAARGAKPDGR